MAREKSDVTVVIINNKSYSILNIELKRLKASKPNNKIKSMLDINKPFLDWVSIASGMGVQGYKAVTLDEFQYLFQKAMIKKGPFLIDVSIENELETIFEN